MSGQVYYDVKDAVIFVKGKVYNFQHNCTLVKIINATIGKKN